MDSHLFIICLSAGILITTKAQLPGTEALDPEISAKCFTYENHFRLQNNIDSSIDPGLTNNIDSGIDPVCVQYFMKRIVSQKKNLPITDDQINFLKSVEREGLGLLMAHKRNKRQVRRRRQLLRKECRTLSERERDNLFDAFRFLKFRTRNNIFDLFVDLHRSDASFRNAHIGSNFLSWHRVYLYYFERILRRIRDTALCYWDSTIEWNLPREEQQNTIAFTHHLFGNGIGSVINGPFSNWPVPRTNITLRRNISAEGECVRPHIADAIYYDLTILNHSQVIFGRDAGFPDPDRNMRRASIEADHNSGHVWVGGVMLDSEIAPQDPIFWFHHCFIDYMWERMRQKMIRNGRNPETDYPVHGGRTHAADFPMEHFFNTSYRWTNRDGYTNSFTDPQHGVYTYAEHPLCGNQCGGAPSRFLYCPPNSNATTRCMTRTVTTDRVPVELGGRTAGLDLAGVAPGVQDTTLNIVANIAGQQREREGLVRVGREFRPSWVDPRTLDAAIPQGAIIPGASGVGMFGGRAVTDTIRYI